MPLSEFDVSQRAGDFWRDLDAGQSGTKACNQSDIALHQFLLSNAGTSLSSWWLLSVGGVAIVATQLFIPFVL